MTASRRANEGYPQECDGRRVRTGWQGTATLVWNQKHSKEDTLTLTLTIDASNRPFGKRKVGKKTSTT